MFLRNSSVRLFCFYSIIILLCFSSDSAARDDSDSVTGSANFAFSQYLGTGFYTTSGQNVFVFQIPLEYTIIDKTETEAGWVLRLPITIGLINFGDLKFDDLPEVEDVTTITFVPGIEYHYPVTPDWTIIPFADYGFAREFSNTSNVLITGIGIKSYADFHINNTILTLGNRFLYAREKNNSISEQSDYMLIETGLYYRLNGKYTSINHSITTNLYYINHYYPDRLRFFERAPNPIVVGVANEIGITFSNLPDFLFFEAPELGFGVRYSNDINVYRIVFGAPF